MIVINNVSERYFSINGVQMAKIFMPMIAGSSAITLNNVFSPDYSLFSPTSFSEVQVDDITYTSQSLLVAALLPVVYLENASFDNRTFNYTGDNVTNEITNNPDNEDLESNSGLLSLKDRSSNVSGSRGYKIIRSDFNFSSIPVNYSNSIWEIRSTHDLGGVNISLPAGVKLMFNGGNISNGTLTGNKTGLEAGSYQIFSDNLVLEGTFNFSKPDIYWFGVLGTGADENNFNIQKYIDLCTINGHTSLFENGLFAFGSINISSNASIKTVNAKILDSNSLTNGSIFNCGAIDGLKIAADFVLRDKSNRALLVSNLESDSSFSNCEISGSIEDQDINRLRSAILINSKFDGLKINLRGSSINSNFACLLDINHGSKDCTGLDVESIVVDSWGSGFIFSGTGYCNGINYIRHFYGSNLKGRDSSQGTFVYSLGTYHIRGLQLGDIYQIDCNQSYYIWRPESYRLLHSENYTGSSPYETVFASMLIEACRGGYGDLYVLNSAYDGFNFTWGGNVIINNLVGESCSGKPLVARYDLLGGTLLDFRLNYFETKNNDQGSILIENTISGNTDGVHNIYIGGGQGQLNNQDSASPDIDINVNRSIKIYVTGVISSSSDSAITVRGAGDYGQVIIQNNPYLTSVGTRTVYITGTLTGGWRLIKDNVVDNVTKLVIDGGSGFKVLNDNFNRATGTILP